MKIADTALGVGLNIAPIQRKPVVLPEQTPIAPAAPPPGQRSGPGPSSEIGAMLAAQLTNFDPRKTPASHAVKVYTSVSRLKGE